MIPFKEVIRAIEAEIPMKDLPECIEWCDSRFANAWSKTLDHLELALLTHDPEVIRREAIAFVASQVELVKRWKQSKQVDEVSRFLSSLK